MRFSSFHPATTGVQGSAPSNIGTIASITNAPVISLSTFIAKDGIVKSYLSGSWDAVAEATTYDIEINNGTAWVISSPVASLKNFEVEIKPSALTYSIRVKGSNKNGLRSGSWSPVSNSVVANGDVTGPGLVTGITGITVDFSSILLSWTNPSDSDLAYVEIRHSLTNDVGTSTSIGKISGTTFNHSKRAEGTTNYYWLRGVDTSGNLGSYATVVSVVMPSVFYDTVPATVPGTPTFTTAVSIAPDGTTVGRMAASWAAVSNAVSYIVHVENTTTSISREYPSPNNSTSLNNIDVIPGHNYRIKVKAVNNISILSAAWSNVSATAVAIGDTTAPGPVTTVTANASLTIVTFTWEDPVVADLNHIRLYKNSTNSIPAKATVYMPLGGRFQYIHNNQGATEYYWLSAVDHSGNESTKVATGPINIPIAGIVNPSPGTYGSATRAPVLSVLANGTVYDSGDVLITPAWSSIASKPTTVAGFGITDAAASAAFTSPTKSLSAIDSRAITNPTTGIGYSGGGRFRFSSLNDDNSTPYADVIDLSTYTDSSGGGFNSLYFSKSTQTILHKWAAAGGTSWTSKTLAYTDSSITGSAATLTTGRTIGMTGDVTWTSAAFNGSGNVTGTATLATVATAGTYRSVTINAKGLVTSGTNPTTLSGYGITDAVSTSTYTAADVLSKLLTVDGSGSGLDADLLDGLDSTSYARLATTSTFTTQQIISGQIVANDWSNYGLQIREVGLVGAAQSSGSYNPSLAFHWSGRVVNRLNMNATGVLLWGTDNIWHAGNDGSGSGLDADLLKGKTIAEAATADTIVSRNGGGRFSAIGIDFYGSSIGDLVNSAPWYGVGKSDITSFGGGGNVIQMAGYYGLRIRSSNSTMDFYQNGRIITAVPTNKDFRVDGILNATRGIIDYSVEDNSSRPARILMPEGGARVAAVGSETGAIKIELPADRYIGNSMLTFTVCIYEYTTGRTRRILCGGYNYDYWVYTSAIQQTESGGNINVRFGRQSSRDCVWIGETSTVWSYPQVWIEDVNIGYAGFSNTWATGWAISLVTSFGTVENTHVAYAQWHGGNDGSGSGLDADLLDGYHANTTAESANTIPVRDSSGWLNQRVIRNINSGSDGMYIGYGNTNSGATRIYGGGSTTTNLTIQATSMTAPGEVYTPSGSYFRAVGTGGFYCETYNGGWNMTDGTWLRSIADKGILTGGAIQGATVTATSDLRLKENVTDLSHALDLVLAMQPRRFNWKKDGRSDIGAIAQELELIVPEVVYNGADDTKTVNYGALGIVAIAAIQELHEIVAALKTRIKVLEAK